MLNSTRFLDAFVQIEDHLAQLTRREKHKSFGQRVSLASRNDPTVRRFRFDLKEFAQLRNAIVHDRAGGEVIAEPNDTVTASIEKIAGLITAPPIVYPLFKRKVFTIQSDASLAKAVQVMGNRNITKLPIIKSDDCIGLLTSNTLTSWLAKQKNKENINLNKSTTGDLLGHNRHEDHYQFIARTTSICHIVEQFEQYERKGKRLDAILITEAGHTDQALLGLITLSDLPRALSEIEA